MERLFTKVVHTLSDVMFEPTIKAQAFEAILDWPPSIPELYPEAVFKYPPLTTVCVLDDVLFLPKATEKVPEELLACPIATAKLLLAVLFHPPVIE